MYDVEVCWRESCSMLGVTFVEGMSVILAKSLELRCGAARKRSLEVCSCFGIGRVSAPAFDGIM